MSSSSSDTITLESYLSSVYSSSVYLSSAYSSSVNSTTSSTSSSSSNSSESTSTDGCVVCSSNTTCPVCDDDEYCLTTSMTCSSCPKTYCAKKSTSSSGITSSSDTSLATTSSSSKNVGAIAGGVVGGVAFLALLIALGLFYYRYYTRKRLAMISADDEFSEKPVSMLRDDTHSRLTKIRNRPRNRNSAATIQTSTASNILPVAYIPGVTTSNQTTTSRRKNSPLSSTRYYTNSDRKSHITLGSSILGEDEDELINRNNNPTDWPDPSNPSDALDLTTAIRAKPKLVQIDELAEEDVNDSISSLQSHTDTTQHNTPSIISNAFTNSTTSATSTLSRDPSESDTDGSFILDVEMPGAPHRI